MMGSARIRSLCLGGAMVGLFGCVGGGPAEQVEAPTPVADAVEKKGEDTAAKKADLERKLKVARRKLEKAELDVAAQQADSADRLRQAEVELTLAVAKLEQYETMDAPNQVASALLSLAATRDRAQEAADELAQIEIMYEEQDLDDRTAEFVVARGRRNAERMAERVKIQEKELVSLKKHSVPQELRRLKLDVDRKESSLAKAKREAESGALSKEIALMSARAEIEKLLEEKKKLEKDAEESSK